MDSHQRRLLRREMRRLDLGFKSDKLAEDLNSASKAIWTSPEFALATALLLFAATIVCTILAVRMKNLSDLFIPAWIVGCIGGAICCKWISNSSVRRVIRWLAIPCVLAAVLYVVNWAFPGDESQSKIRFTGNTQAMLISASPSARSAFMVVPTNGTQTATPVTLVYIQIHNKQDIPATIDSYTFYPSIGQKKRAEIALKTVSLETNIPVYMGFNQENCSRGGAMTFALDKRAYMFGDPGPQNLVAKVLKPIDPLEAALHAPIPAHGTVSGWEAFSANQFVGKLSLVLHDVESGDNSIEVVPPVPELERIHQNTNKGEIVSTGQCVDLSNYHTIDGLPLR